MYLIRCMAGGLVAAALTVAPGALANQPEHRQALESCAGKDASCARPADEHDHDASPASATDGLGVAADAGRLEGTRGGSGGTNIDIDTALDGSVSGNSATHVVTGDNIIQSGSFANVSGIPIVIQNSGANVLIQNATVINLQLK